MKESIKVFEVLALSVISSLIKSCLFLSLVSCMKWLKNFCRGSMFVDKQKTEETIVYDGINVATRFDSIEKLFRSRIPDSWFRTRCNSCAKSFRSIRRVLQISCFETYSKQKDQSKSIFLTHVYLKFFHLFHFLLLFQF